MLLKHLFESFGYNGQWLIFIIFGFLRLHLNPIGLQCKSLLRCWFFVSSCKCISWIGSFLTRSSNLRVLWSCASSVDMILAHHLLLWRHLNTFLTISSLVYVFLKDLRFLIILVKRIYMSLMDSSRNIFRSSSWWT